VSEERVEWVVQRRWDELNPRARWQDYQTYSTLGGAQLAAAHQVQTYPGLCSVRLVRRTVREEVCE
jgi:hypothetical protein